MIRPALASAKAGRVLFRAGNFRMGRVSWPFLTFLGPVSRGFRRAFPWRELYACAAVPHVRGACRPFAPRTLSPMISPEAYSLPRTMWTTMDTRAAMKSPRCHVVALLPSFLRIEGTMTRHDAMTSAAPIQPNT